jgi:hypothetical protein
MIFDLNQILKIETLQTMETILKSNK